MAQKYVWWTRGEGTESSVRVIVVVSEREVFPPLLAMIFHDGKLPLENVRFGSVGVCLTGCVLAQSVSGGVTISPLDFQILRIMETNQNNIIKGRSNFS